MLKKAIFIDRDGTIIKEPADEQIDSLEKLEFVPGCISALRLLAGQGYELVMVSNWEHRVSRKKHSGPRTKKCWPRWPARVYALTSSS